MHLCLLVILHGDKLTLAMSFFLLCTYRLCQTSATESWILFEKAMRRGFASDIKPYHPDGSLKNYVDVFMPEQEAFAMFVICIYFLGTGELSISKDCFLRYKVCLTLCLFSFVSVLYNVWLFVLILLSLGFCPWFCSVLILLYLFLFVF